MAGLDILLDSDYEPVSLDLAKSQCRIDSTVDDDYLTGLVVPGAREFVELVTARSLRPRTYCEYFDGFPGQNLPIPYNMAFDLPTHHQFKSIPRRRFELMRSPLVELVSIKYLDQAGEEQLLDSSLYYLSNHPQMVKPAEVLHQPHAEWPIPSHRVDSVWIEYKAGYRDPGATDTEDYLKIPTTCVQAMLLLISHWYENRLPLAPAAAELPFAISSLLDNNRVYYQA